jgi:hypothetical protein
MSPLARASLPHASVYLLNRYLAMHPNLRTALNNAIQRGSGSVKWSVATILHRMQQIIRVSLKYHGLTPDGPLVVEAASSSYGSSGPRDFQVRVRIADRELLMGDHDGVVPGKNQVARVERALAWVIWTLFIYSDELDLKHAPFW